MGVFNARLVSIGHARREVAPCESCVSVALSTRATRTRRSPRSSSSAIAARSAGAAQRGGLLPLLHPRGDARGHDGTQVCCDAQEVLEAGAHAIAEQRMVPLPLT
jgi:hypothetical protein